jgi:hypothetical protein
VESKVSSISKSSISKVCTFDIDIPSFDIELAENPSIIVAVGSATIAASRGEHSAAASREQSCTDEKSD